jgi:hypothetical protein
MDDLLVNLSIRSGAFVKAYAGNIHKSLFSQKIDIYAVHTDAHSAHCP